MQSLPRIGQLIEANASLWQRPVADRQFNSPWALEHGFAHEDWNFALHDSVDGCLYGYGQGRPAETRLQASRQQFDVFFYFRDAEGQYRAAGFYLNATFLNEEESASAWEMLRQAGILERRAEHLRALQLRYLNRRLRDYLQWSGICWRAKLEDVRILDELPIFEPLRATDWRFSNAYDYNDWTGWDSLMARSRKLTGEQPKPMQRPRIHHIRLQRYRAFPEAELQLAPLTFIIGRNNAGKSALCRAPWIFSQCWHRDARLPVILKTPDLDLGGTLADLVHLQSPRGVSAEFRFQGEDRLRRIRMETTFLPEKANRQQVMELSLFGGDDEILLAQDIPAWPSVQTAIQQFPILSQFASEIELVLGLRTLPSRDERWDGYSSNRIGASGKDAYALWAAAVERQDRPLLERFEDAFSRILLARPLLELRDGRINVLIEHKGTGVRSHLLDAGAGLGQALPLIAGLTLLPPAQQPSLYCIEQPELHLHPRAHGELAEFFADCALEFDGPHFLIETHSDAIILRVRALVAERKLRPEQIRIYFVDDGNTGGSQVKEIPLNDRGTPQWWPEGIFAEPQEEFLRIRRALAGRDKNSQAAERILA